MIPIRRKHGLILLDDDDAWVTREYFLTGQVHPGGYRRVRAQNKKTQKVTTLGRVLLGITDPRLQADHINHDGFDNRRDNLRVVDRDLQSANRRSSNSWGYKGIRDPDRNGQSFHGRLYRSGVRYSGPRRPSPEKAALDYNRMAIAVWGHQVVINDVRCVDMEPRPAERNCMFCNAPCHCCCVCFDPPSSGMRRLFEMLDAA